MTRKEKEKKFLEALDLRMGDIIEITNIIETIFKIIEMDDRYVLSSCSNNNYILPLIYIMIYEFEVIQYHQKTYGEYKCNDIKCVNCPLKILECNMDRVKTQTLYECLNTTITNYSSKIYNAFADELNKVVEDENKILN